MNENQPQDKKIIIDEDWKARAQAEKEELARKQKEKQAQGETAKETDGPAHRRGPLPPPSLLLLATSLAMQATVSLGLVSDSSGDKPVTDLEQAKHFIDTISLLYEKTEGNRTADETAALDDLLHQLRLSYVMAVERGTAPTGG